MESSDKNGLMEGNRGEKCLFLGSLQASRIGLRKETSLPQLSA